MKRSDVNILIVEDDKSFGKVLKESLSKIGVTVRVSTSPTDALNQSRLQTNHLAIIDCMLPKMNGIDLAIEMRQTQFDQSPIILMSGIFKEKAFENESLTKTGAVSFLKKPFDLKKLEELVLKSLGGLLESETWSLKSLLARRLRSVRDRMKVIESLESITGLDIPMVFSILCDAKVSGHLNFVTAESEIYGVTFCRGKITAFDSERAETIILDQLKKNNFLSNEDWEEFLKLGEKRSIVNKLINKGFVSPHAIESAKADQIKEELSSLIANPMLQVSFVPDDSVDSAGGLDFVEVYAAVQDQFKISADLSFFQELYKDYHDSPIRLTESSQNNEHVWALEIVTAVKGLRAKIEDSQTITDICSSLKSNELQIFSAIHSLVVNRVILFDDLQKTRNSEASLERVKKLHRDLSALNPQEIFMYFGASQKVAESEIQKIFKSFNDTNHPDLVKDESKDVRDLTLKVYSLVKDAHETLTDAVKREQFFELVKEKTQTIQVEAGVLSEQGLGFLRRGQSQAALDALDKAFELTPTPRLFYLKVWAELKARPESIAQGRLIEILEKLEGLSAEDKRDAFYWMALGLAKKASGDPRSSAYFEKAVQLDHAFVEARRELNAIQMESAQQKTNSKTMDFLKGDITELVSQIFRKKSG